jgi:hypothetical protein
MHSQVIFDNGVMGQLYMFFQAQTLYIKKKIFLLLYDFLPKVNPGHFLSGLAPGKIKHGF